MTPQGTQNTGSYYGTLSGTGATSTAIVAVPAVQAPNMVLQVTCDGSDPSFTCQPYTFTATVGKGNATPVLTSISPTSPANNQTVYATATVRGPALPEAPIPTGNVQLRENNTATIAPVFHCTIRVTGTTTPAIRARPARTAPKPPRR